MKYEEIKNLSVSELQKRLANTRKALFTARIKHKMKRLSNAMELRVFRKDMARLSMALNFKKQQQPGLTIKPKGLPIAQPPILGSPPAAKPPAVKRTAEAKKPLAHPPKKTRPPQKPRVRKNPKQPIALAASSVKTKPAGKLKKPIQAAASSSADKKQSPPRLSFLKKLFGNRLKKQDQKPIKEDHSK